VGDVFLPGVVDLLGHPVPASRGKKGRPPHVPTPEFRRFVELGLACGHEESEIAAAMRITERTLKRHYFHELQVKRAARLRLDIKNMAAIVAKVEAGEVSAMALLEKKLERLRQAELQRGKAPAAEKPKKLGKKEQALVEAHRAGRESEWEGLLN